VVPKLPVEQEPNIETAPAEDQPLRVRRIAKIALSEEGKAHLVEFRHEAS
jgi:hypothetical protein